MATEREIQRREATDAFRSYARRGLTPRQTEILDPTVWMDDLAVAQTISLLNRTGKGYIVDALKEIYFAEPDAVLHKSDIEMRVTRFTMTHHVCRTSVYKWLSVAREIYLGIRHY